MRENASIITSVDRVVFAILANFRPQIAGRCIVRTIITSDSAKSLKFQIQGKTLILALSSELNISNFLSILAQNSINLSKYLKDSISGILDLALHSTVVEHYSLIFHLTLPYDTNQ